MGIMCVGYLTLSHKQHQINKSDTTIPTVTQIWEGTVNLCENLKSWNNKLEIKDANLRMFPTTQDLVDGWNVIKRSKHPDELKETRKQPKRAIVADSMITFSRLIKGLFFGTFFAVFLGLFMGSFAVIEAFLLPTISLLAKIPPTAAMAMFFVIVGLNEPMYIWVIGFGITPTLAMSIHLAVKDIEMELIYKGQTLGASRLEIVFRIIFPIILPKIIDGIRLSIGPAMVFLIAAEYMVADIGFGYRFRLEGKRMAMSIVYFYLVYLSAFGLFMDKLLSTARDVLCPWANEDRQRVPFFKRLALGLQGLMVNPFSRNL